MFAVTLWNVSSEVRLYLQSGQKRPEDNHIVTFTKDIVVKIPDTHRTLSYFEF